MKTQDIRILRSSLKKLFTENPGDLHKNEEYNLLLGEMDQYLSGIKRENSNTQKFNHEKELNRIFDSLPYAVFICNQAGILQKYNEKAGDLLEIEKLLPADFSFSQFFSDKLICDFLLDEMKTNGRIADIEAELKTTGERQIPFLISGSAIQFDDDPDISFLCVAADISELKEIQNRLSEAKNRAEEASKSKSNFLANMSHEIRTPLNGIIGLNRLMLQSDLPPEQTEFVKMIQYSADSLLRLINDILDFSKIEAGKLDIEYYEFSIKDLIGGLSSIFQQQIDQKGLAIEIHIDEMIPEILIGDMARIRQILVNLLGNAIKFTRKGKITLSAVMFEEGDEHHIIKISVSDTGIGIPEGKQQEIFESFSQADASTTRQYGGTGLGLSICRRLAWLMNGNLDVYSRENQGSTFWITLPLGYNISELKGEKGEHESYPERQIGNLNILLVEDNPINQKVAVRLLEKNKFKVDIAQNGEQAVEKYLLNSYDLILMDLQMPVMDGFTATKIIREHEVDAHIPIIALTANAMKGDKEKCLQAGMDEYVTKPINMNNLLKVILNIFQSNEKETVAH